MPGMILVECRPCVVCGKRAELTLDYTSYKKWREGMKVQDAFPELDPDTRELLISGTHPACWDELYPNSQKHIMAERNE